MRKPTRLDARSAIRCAVAEVLEPRRLFAAIESGILVARGTANADTISIRRTGTDDVIVTTNGANQTFDMDNFTGVRLEGLGGNDTFNMIDALVSPLVRNTTVLGGAGSDTISYATRTAALNVTVDPARGIVASGSQTDDFLGVETIIGGAGHDTFDYGNFVEIPPEQEGQQFAFRVEGRGGNDSFNDRLIPTLDDNFDVITLFGGDGDDYFNDDENPEDQFFGEAGNDFLGVYENSGVSGGSGIDTMSVFTWDDVVVLPADVENLSHVGTGFANAITVIGNDLPNRIDLSEYGDPVTVRGLGGDDTIIGADYEDSLDGGEGNDSLIGGRGNDTLNGGNGTDFGDGGAGTNTLISIENTPGSTDPTLPNIAITGGVLVANGTGGADTFTLRRTGTDNVIVTVNALSREFDMDDFSGGVRLVGFGGNDVFNLNAVLNTPVSRATTVFGGAGNDTVSFATRTAAVTVNGYRDPNASMNVPYLVVTSSGVTDRLDNTVETIIGGSGNDDMGASDFSNLGVDYPLPHLRFEGRGGNDLLSSAAELTADLIGGAGDDHFIIDESSSGSYEGGDGNDLFDLNNFALVTGINGGAGIDTLNVTSSHRRVLDMRLTPGVENAIGVGFNQGEGYEFFGNDLANRITVASDAFSGTVHGMGGNDTLIGGARADSLDGGEGNDSLVGGPGNDTLDGGSGTDFADGDGGQNTHISIEQFAGGGTGTASIAIVNRILTATGTDNAETISIERHLSDDVIVKVGSLSKTFDMDDFDGVLLQSLGGKDFIEVIDAITTATLTRKVTLDGGAGDDSLYGSDGADILRGGDGNDTIWGVLGDDALFGGGGNDVLYGGSGADFMDGGDNDDFIDAAEGESGDTVLGGNGNDTAKIDSADNASGVEAFA